MTDNIMNEEELAITEADETAALWASWSDVEDEENYGDSYTDDEYEDEDEDDEDYGDEDEDEDYDDDDE